jgi:hypothetical protein
MKNLILFAALSFIAPGYAHTGQDRELANQVAAYLKATNVATERNYPGSQTDTGKKLYFGSRGKGAIHVTYYGISSNKDLETIKAAAEAAARDLPKVKVITLIFYERQALIKTDSGGYLRDDANLNEIAKFVIKRK